MTAVGAKEDINFVLWELERQTVAHKLSHTLLDYHLVERRAHLVDHTLITLAYAKLLIFQRRVTFSSSFVARVHTIVDRHGFKL
jgi:hypothetical protein